VAEPEEETEERTERDRCDDENPRGWEGLERNQNDAGGKNQADRVPSDQPHAKPAMRPDLIQVELRILWALSARKAKLEMRHRGHH
jgi:hypothetical protein